ncbi:hypothetical protein CL616_04980 [archaeon]|nr:hypothetical protein [archaeon]|tara:strand:+ start:149 stop:382 length:234 start_codon:yes stop_codon:yes gene_type:complete
MGFLRDYILLKDWMRYGNIGKEQEAQLESGRYIIKAHTRVPSSKMGEGNGFTTIKHLVISEKGRKFLDRWFVLDYIL